ncbi:hypothetical protein VTK26DRAFT_3680 [Humicola hyalothermophila]
MTSLPFPFTSVIRSSSEWSSVVDRRRGDARSGLPSADSFLRLRSCCFRVSVSWASRRISGNTSFECLNRSRSLSSSVFGGGALLCCLRATVRLKGSARFLGGSAGCSSAAMVTGSLSVGRRMCKIRWVSRCCGGLLVTLVAHGAQKCKFV